IWEPVTFHIARIETELVAAARESLGVREPASSLPVVLPDDCEAAAACRTLQRALFGGSDALAQREALDCALVHIARLGARSLCRRELTPERVRRAQRYMREQLEHQLSLDELAAEAGADSFALIRAFRRHVGMSPYEWLTQTRVQRACDLLARGAK